MELLILNQRIERFQARYSWLENLTSTVSHEMRTPLGGIMQTVQRVCSLPDSCPPHERHRLLKMIFFQAELMLGFVNDLLDLKQIKHGVFKQIVTVFDPNRVMMMAA